MTIKSLQSTHPSELLCLSPCRGTLCASPTSHPSLQKAAGAISLGAILSKGSEYHPSLSAPEVSSPGLSSLSLPHGPSSPGSAVSSRIKEWMAHGDLC